MTPQKNLRRPDERQFYRIGALAHAGVVGCLDTVTVQAFTNKNVATIKVICASSLTTEDASDLDVTHHCTIFCVGKEASLAVLAITANGNSRLAAGITCSSFAAGNISAALCGVLTCPGSAQCANTASRYVTAPTGLSTDNYGFAYFTGVPTLKLASVAKTALNGSVPITTRTSTQKNVSNPLPVVNFGNNAGSASTKPAASQTGFISYSITTFVDFETGTFQ